MYNISSGLLQDPFKSSVNNPIECNFEMVAGKIPSKDFPVKSVIKTSTSIINVHLFHFFLLLFVIFVSSFLLSLFSFTSYIRFSSPIRTANFTSQVFIDRIQLFHYYFFYLLNLSSWNSLFKFIIIFQSNSLSLIQ